MSEGTDIKTGVKRLNYMDLARGIGMILVLMVHSDFSGERMSAFTTSFYMSVFFILSGMLSRIRKEAEGASSPGALIRKKAGALLVPYAWFSAILLIEEIVRLLCGTVEKKVFFPDLIDVLLFNAGGALWFLPALFFGEVIFFLLLSVFRRSAKDSSGEATSGEGEKGSRPCLFVLPVTFIAAAAAVLLFNRFGRETLIGTRLLPGDGAGVLLPYALSVLFLLVSRNLLSAFFLAAGYFAAGAVDRLTERGAYPHGGGDGEADGNGNRSGRRSARSRLIAAGSGIVLLLLTIPVSLKNGAIDFNRLYFGNPLLFLISSMTGTFGLILLCKGICPAYGKPLFRPLLFFGRNSLIILCTHLNFYLLYAGILGAWQIDRFVTRAKSYVFLFNILLITLLLEVPVIFLIKRYAPFLTGKKNTGQKGGNPGAGGRPEAAKAPSEGISGSIRRENLTMRFLSAIGIIFIVAGHLNLNAFDAGGLFPYYSFHVYIFLFIAGYFYRGRGKEKPSSFLCRKAEKLLLPYFLWNLFYGIFSTVMNAQGITAGGKLSFFNLFAAPFLGGHQFMFNFPAWFVPALFLTEMAYALGETCLGFLIAPLFRRKAADGTGKKEASGSGTEERITTVIDYLMLVFTLALGILTVFLAIGGHVWGYYRDIGRILIMLPGISFGRIYRRKLERYRRDGILFHVIFSAAVLLIQLVIRHFCAGLAFSTVWVTSFANGPVIPFLTVITGIAFWLEVAVLMEKAFEYVKRIREEEDEHTPGVHFAAGALRGILEGVLTTGRHSFSVMTHHIFVLFLINSLIFFLFLKTGFCPGFDRGKYMTDLNYVAPFAGEQFTKWIDLFFCLAVPSGAAAVFTAFKKRGKGETYVG
ncbi:MAG: acyltransferase family protein [Lachnospiraceae bacterium]|nr:acyltransferase family protein [Lachnospiraceae bacterium]